MEITIDEIGKQENNKISYSCSNDLSKSIRNHIKT